MTGSLQRVFASLLVCCSITVARSDAAEMPNILWITAEDMSATLGCYGDSFANTPHLDAFAQASTRYTLAFATAPVCSPSRACLINGLTAPSQGAHAMRSEFPLPTELKGFPAWLRARGYYTSNREKTDYNSAAADRIIEASWDETSAEADWRGRQPGQPFFSIFNLMTSHQSRTMVWPYEQFQSEVQSQLQPDQIHDPQSVPVPPYYPDTPLVRKTLARYYDCVTLMDQEVGEILQQLHDDGLAENTIVFFYSDHGSGMPRHKRTLFDSGMHVPLMVRFPPRYESLRPTEPGATSDRLVCFEDFGPTVLSLAGIAPLPSWMRGKPFLGPLDTGDDHAPKYLFGHRDRVDEVIDMARSVRSADFLYIRNYMPHLGWNQTSNWTDEGEIADEFYQLADAGKATPAQQQFVGSTRPVEALFDCRHDPTNLNNLVDAPEHQSKLAEMRSALRQHLIDSRDLGFVPEIELWRLAGDSPPMAAGIIASPVDQLRIEAAERVGSDAVDRLVPLLTHDDASVRYWGAVGCSAARTLPADGLAVLRDLLDDESLAVQIEAATALVRHGQRETGHQKLLRLIQGDDLTVVLHAARAIEVLGDPTNQAAMQSLAAKFADDQRDMAMFIRFTANGYLSRMPNR